MEILTVTINGNILSVNSLNMGPRFRVVKSSRLPAKIAAYLVSIGRLLCLAFLYGWRFLNKISLDWSFLTTLMSRRELFQAERFDLPVTNLRSCWD